MLLTTAVDLKKAVLFFPILDRFGRRTALTYLAAMVFEVALMAVGALFLLSLVPMAEQLQAGEISADLGGSLGALAVDINTLAYQIAQAGLAFRAVVLCVLLYRTRLIPRFLAAWGAVAYVVHFAGAGAEIFGGHVSLVLLIPGGLFEMTFGVGLLVNGLGAATGAQLPDDMALNRKGPMAGRIVLITGASRGIGKATAAGLTALGARVAITGRGRRRTEAAAREVGTAGAPVDFFVADLSSQAEVRRLVDEALERLPRIDVLVNNVGGYWNTRRATVDGLEHTFAVNHLAPFLLANVLFTYELARQLSADEVTANAVHPGLAHIVRSRGPGPLPTPPRAVPPPHQGNRRNDATSAKVWASLAGCVVWSGRGR
ncbi:MAG: SDR family NAD(P)-dependent oxidoreductase [Nocardioidaceae bacterium]